MLILYKNVRNVRFLLFTKISNIQQIEHTPEKLNSEDLIGLFLSSKFNLAILAKLNLRKNIIIDHSSDSVK